MTTTMLFYQVLESCLFVVKKKRKDKDIKKFCQFILFAKKVVMNFIQLYYLCLKNNFRENGIIIDK